MSRFGFKIDGDTLENNYKEHLSGFREWDQLAHADNWLLLVENMGEHMNIDECMHARDLFTFVSNKDGHGNSRCPWHESLSSGRGADADPRGEATGRQGGDDGLF